MIYHPNAGKTPHLPENDRTNADCGCPLSFGPARDYYK